MSSNLSGGRPIVQTLNCLRVLLREEDGQDLIEYSLLITFIAIACAAIVGTTGSAVTPIWTAGNAQISSANTFAGS